ncbi:MAG: hypothetical protein JW993_10870 [Sedimentisphaerales bacterium]|nr:hypothetical protein [Sedimentisphaerales bacterium]
MTRQREDIPNLPGAPPGERACDGSLSDEQKAAFERFGRRLRVLQVIDAIDTKDRTLFVGRQRDVFNDVAASATSAPKAETSSLRVCIKRAL